MSYAYHERMHKEIEAAREAVSKASMPTDQTREIDYWIYELRRPFPVIQSTYGVF